MRMMVPGLRSAVPLAPRLPSVLQEDPFLQRFLRAFDDSLAPVFATLDGLTAYFDPTLAPEDFVSGLADWVGVPLDDEWSLAQRRKVLTWAVGIHSRRGTMSGVADAVRLGVRGVIDVVVEDSGGVAWSTTAGADLPGDPRPAIRVTAKADAVKDVNLARLDAVVASVKPAHVPHSVQVVEAYASGRPVWKGPDANL